MMITVSLVNIHHPMDAQLEFFYVFALYVSLE